MGAAGSYLGRLALTVDQAVNAVSGGSPDETISARAYRQAEAGNTFWKIGRTLIDWLFFWQPQHTKDAYLAEQARCHLPGSYRGPEGAAVCD